MPKSQTMKGFTLIEIMIAMIIGLVLMSTLIEIYISATHSYQMQNALINLQNNANAAINLLNHEIADAGYIGCRRLSQSTAVQGYSGYTLTLQNKLMGNDKEVIVRHASNEHAVLLSDMTAADELQISSEIKLKPGILLIISDCARAEIVKVKSVTVKNTLVKLITADQLHHLFKRNAQVAKLQINRFYIDKIDQSNSDGSPNFALYVERVDGVNAVVVDGINTMAIAYDYDDLNKNDWSHVIGVSIRLEMQADKIKKNWFTYVSLR